LTPEAFFRICDNNYKCKITMDDLRKGIESLAIGLSRNQIRRIEILLDENMTGYITLEEYQNALEAF
jgi:Ca2+-binding EF-hand superfamily protein